ncbi:Flp family type IVb pilin [Desulfoscipio geothermicus]|uniref:Pilus assembly protein Flp/PilA n=1 Tax=Desulfoscipio geothermicus DSM 3669 TaxID=1121426 RepID=A0A1I6D111_9FIRM|nr:hypothetical protein [Desulfoscipio geothermicus]SFQ99149.1 pilus assembly protein Flp/PilA [Desulfoscipio geothermicus DSM 3669]
MPIDSLLTLLKNVVIDETGQGIVECVLILSLIAVMCITALQSLAPKIIILVDKTAAEFQ